MAFMELFKEYVTSQKTVPDKTVIFRENGPGAAPMVILSGTVKIKKTAGNAAATVEKLSAGSFIGESYLLNPESGMAEASVVADGPVTLGVLDVARLESEIAQLGPALRATVAAVVRRRRGCVRQIGMLAAE